MYTVIFKDGTIITTVMTQEQRAYCIQQGAIAIRKIKEKK